MKMRLSMGNVSARSFGIGGAVLAVAAVDSMISPKTLAAPYASNVLITGTSVNFILNEAADALTVSIDGGAPQVLDGSTAGTKGFTLPSASSTFSINAQKTDPIGYQIPTGLSQGSSTTGLSFATQQAGTRYIGSTNSANTRFNSPRGVSVGTNPNQSNFGTAYVSNSAVGTLAASGALPARTLGDGLYAIHSDLSDAFGYSNTAQAASLTFTNSTSSPFRIQAAADGFVYITDFSDSDGKLARMSSNLTTGQLVLAANGGVVNSTTPDLPAGQNHGSTLAVHARVDASGLTLYTLDEDLSSGHVAGGANSGDYNSLWRYDVGNATLPYSAMPTKLNHLLVGLVTTGTNATPIVATSDIDRGSDGKLYMGQSRANGGEAGIFVLDTDGSTVLFNSLSASRALLANSTAKDIFTNVMGLAVSPDQKFLAVILNSSDVAVMPLVNGIPQIDQRVIVDTGTDVASGRDIAFDAADNIYYVSSGQSTLRILSPGGVTSSTLSYDGSSYSYSETVAAPEPGTLALASLSLLSLLRRRRRPPVLSGEIPVSQ
ncbi:MAG: hypothetical protein JWN40_3470 [Phycisphaerales bacterium]|nr:hypothetical protein [Phycisphaerales bacterium]